MSKFSVRDFSCKNGAYCVFLGSLMLSTKFLQDGAMKNDNWATYVAPWFSLQELNTIEKSFLAKIDYNINLQPEQLEQIIIKDTDLYDVVVPSALLPSFDDPRCYDDLFPTENYLQSDSSFDHLGCSLLESDPLPELLPPISMDFFRCPPASFWRPETLWTPIVGLL